MKRLIILLLLFMVAPLRAETALSPEYIKERIEEFNKLYEKNKCDEAFHILWNLFSKGDSESAYILAFFPLNGINFPIKIDMKNINDERKHLHLENGMKKMIYFSVYALFLDVQGGEKSKLTREIVSSALDLNNSKELKRNGLLRPIFREFMPLIECYKQFETPQFCYQMGVALNIIPSKEAFYKSYSAEIKKTGAKARCNVIHYRNQLIRKEVSKNRP